MNPHLKTARTLAKLLDSQFSIFGYKVGIDPLLGLIPGIGDTISLLLSGYLIWIAYHLKLSSHQILRMMGNVLLDYIISLIPIAGEVWDFFYKANLKNLDILNSHAKNVIEGEIIEPK